MKTYLLILGLGFALTACSSEGNNTGPVRKVVQAQVKATIAKRAAKRAGKTIAPKELTRADIKGIKEALIIISVPKIGYKEIAKKVANNGGYENFYTGTNKSFVLRNGQLTATRGLRYDLMSRSLTQSPRKYNYLSATNGIATLAVNCETASKASQTVTILERQYNLALTEEVCRNSFTGFKNRVWRDSSGKAWKAEQWIGKDTGFAIIEWLN